MSDSFLNSMTFASNGGGSRRRVHGSDGGGDGDSFMEGFLSGGGGCDCDECGIREVVPGPILEAMREHKRQKVAIKRTQERTLVCRSGQISVWDWVMPLEAEPLIEYGSTHRIVWIEKLPGHLKSIGKGIIGSSDEENTRIDLENWIEGGIYLVPSNGGKAIGFIHTANKKAVLAASTDTIISAEEEASTKSQAKEPTIKTDDNDGSVEKETKHSEEEEKKTDEKNEDENSSNQEDVAKKSPSLPPQPSSAVSSNTSDVQEIRGHALLRTMKIPIDAASNSSPATTEGWMYMLITLCENLLNKKKNERNKNESPIFQYYEFPEDCQAIIRRALEEAEEKSNSSGGSF